jgi:LysR family transcriptional activator of nhaA
MIKPWINYHHLLYFKTIADEKSFSKAALKLKLSQPTLSLQIKSFEETIGIELFDRKNKKITLTARAKDILNYANQIFSLGDEILKLVEDKDFNGNKKFTIGAIDSIPKQVISAIIGFIKRKFQVHIIVIEGSVDFLLDEQKNLKIDLIVTNFVPLQLIEKDFEYKKIHQDKVNFYGTLQWKKLSKNFPRSLNDKEVILPTYNSKLRYDIESWFINKNLKPLIIVESQDIALNKQLAVDNLGIIPLSEFSAKFQVINKLLFKIGNIENIFEEIFFIRNHKVKHSPIVNELFISFKI